MPKFFNQGAQLWKYKCLCGFYVEGSVREANMKIKLHNKKCELKDQHFLSIPTYNKSNAEQNGVLQTKNSMVRNALTVTENWIWKNFNK